MPKVGTPQCEAANANCPVTKECCASETFVLRLGWITLRTPDLARAFTLFLPLAKLALYRRQLLD